MITATTRTAIRNANTPVARPMVAITYIAGGGTDLAEMARRGVDIYNPHSIYGRRRPTIAL